MIPYATVKDLETLTIQGSALAPLPDKDKTEALESASEEADGFLQSQYQLPLKKWGKDLKQHVCDIAAFRLLKKRGMNPSTPGAEYTLTREAYDDAFGWLKAISGGRVKPPAIVDSSSEVDEGGIGIATSTRRGW